NDRRGFHEPARQAGQAIPNPATVGSQTTGNYSLCSGLCSRVAVCLPRGTASVLRNKLRWTVCLVALRSYTPLVKRCPHTLDKRRVCENYEFVDRAAARSPPRDVQYPFLMFWFALDADRALPTIDALGGARFELKRQPGGVAVSREV